MSLKRQFLKTFIGLLTLIVPVILMQILPSKIFAAPEYTSPNYGIDEVFMGAGGLNDATSANYQARASLGDIAVGNGLSNLYQLWAGFTTTPDPYIELVVSNSSQDIGYLSTAAATTATATFTVRAYLASGYVVTTGSDPPSNGSYTMSTPSTPIASSVGTEQFAINLVANTNPSSFGADPAQIPDASYSFGEAASNYDTANVYKYTKGDIIASSSKSSGVTQYTVSYLYNISTTTPSGLYTFSHIIIATATY